MLHTRQTYRALRQPSHRVLISHERYTPSTMFVLYNCSRNISAALLTGCCAVGYRCEKHAITSKHVSNCRRYKRPSRYCLPTMWLAIDRVHWPDVILYMYVCKHRRRKDNCGLKQTRYAGLRI